MSRSRWRQPDRESQSSAVLEMCSIHIVYIGLEVGLLYVDIHIVYISRPREPVFGCAGAVLEMYRIHIVYIGLEVGLLYADIHMVYISRPREPVFGCAGDVGYTVGDEQRLRLPVVEGHLSLHVCKYICIDR